MRFIQNFHAKFRSRYGNIEKRKGNMMLLKKLKGKTKQYFDSGDHFISKTKTKIFTPNPLAKQGTSFLIKFSIFLFAFRTSEDTIH